MFRKNLQLKDASVNEKCLLRKVFYRQRILESSCDRKETVDIEISVTSRNGDRNIMQSIGITIRPSSRIRKWNQFSQFK